LPAVVESVLDRAALARSRGVVPMVMKAEGVPRWISNLAPMPVSALTGDSSRFHSISRLLEVVDVELNRSLVLERQCQPTGGARSAHRSETRSTGWPRRSR